MPPLEPPLVVGAGGRVGGALMRLCPNAVPVLKQPLTGGQSLRQHLEAGDSSSRAASPRPPRPILVATTNDALEQVIADTPSPHRRDLVFLQNGMLLPLLSRYGLQGGGSTQALLYFSAASDGSIVDGGMTAVSGRWASHFASLLCSRGIACRSVGQGEYLALMIEKLLWASIYWLLSAGLGGLPVGEVACQHGDAAEELAAELLPLAQAYVLGLAMERGSAGGPGSSSSSSGSSSSSSGSSGGERPVLGSTEQVAALTVAGVCLSMADYSLSIPQAVPSRDMALAEFRWRNGWFLEQARTPAHAAWLARAGIEV